MPKRLCDQVLQWVRTSKERETGTAQETEDWPIGKQYGAVRQGARTNKCNWQRQVCEPLGPGRTNKIQPHARGESGKRKTENGSLGTRGKRAKSCDWFGKRRGDGATALRGTGTKYKWTRRSRLTWAAFRLFSSASSSSSFPSTFAFLCLLLFQSLLSLLLSDATLQSWRALSILPLCRQVPIAYSTSSQLTRTQESFAAANRRVASSRVANRTLTVASLSDGVCGVAHQLCYARVKSKSPEISAQISVTASHRIDNRHTSPRLRLIRLSKLWQYTHSTRAVLCCAVR